MAILWHLLIGAVAGYLAGVIVKGRGFGILGDIVVGIVGALLGGWLFGRIGFSLPGGDLIGSILTATLGAILFLVLIRVIRRV